MYNPLKEFKILKNMPKKKGFKSPPDMPKSAMPIVKLKSLHKNPGK